MYAGLLLEAETRDWEGQREVGERDAGVWADMKKIRKPE